MYLTIRRDAPAESSAFFQWPLPSPLLFVNESSDARDHCANERSLSTTNILTPRAMLS